MVAKSQTRPTQLGTHEPTSRAETETQTQRKDVQTQCGEGAGGTDWESSVDTHTPPRAGLPAGRVLLTDTGLGALW